MISEMIQELKDYIGLQPIITCYFAFLFTVMTLTVQQSFINTIVVTGIFVCVPLGISIFMSAKSVEIANNIENIF
jgi:hypothetical protein